MSAADRFMELGGQLVPLLATLLIVIGGLVLTNRALRRYWAEDPDAQFRFQLIMLALTLSGVIAIIIVLPVDEALRGQLLGLLGILLSAAIALSSTTFIGNILAGIMLKTVKSARPGDFITVADLTGRITEMDLLHTEIQTEFRDLVTVPNLYMVTHPLQVVRASGTIISAEVSLGYDVPHGEVLRILCDAAVDAGLKDPFVHVRELGDFAVLYRVAGLLEDVQSLISARSRLRAAMLDGLHAAQVEIVSPGFMNSRALAESDRFIPEPSRPVETTSEVQAEDVAFDLADEAASVEELKKSIELIDEELEALGQEADEAVTQTIEKLETRKARLSARVAEATESLKAAASED